MASSIGKALLRNKTGDAGRTEATGGLDCGTDERTFT